MWLHMLHQPGVCSHTGITGLWAHQASSRVFPITFFFLISPTPSLFLPCHKSKGS